MQPSTYRLGYRSDIEGLRAIAILLVVAAHAHITGFAGGFVGVDVFFVLSGYLITGLLLQEVEQCGQLKFAAFYARRLRRLLPGLLLMLACVAVLGWLLLAPGEQPEQASAAGTAALWISNFFFAFDHLDYFNPGSETNLFLHTWSLGVEEQFYLVWPLLLVLATGAWAGARKAPDLHRVKVVMPIIFVASLAACAVWAQRDPTLAFYMMPARAWQFALGALVFAYFRTPAAISNGTPVASNILRAPVWLGWSGVAAILIAGVVLGPNVTYPWPWALVPSLGTAAILASGASSPASGAGALLSLRPLQALGRVSYAWYLWHWPVLLLGAIMGNAQGVATRLALVGVSYAAAVVTSRYVEVPIRRQQAVDRFPRTAVAGAFIVMILVGIAGAKWRDEAADHLQRPEHQRYASLVYDAPIIYNMDCDDWYHSSDVKPCAFGPLSAPHTAVIMGDSVGLQWFPAVVRIFHPPDWRLVVFTKSACPMVDTPIFYPRIRRTYTECAQWRTEALRQVAALKPNVLLLGSTYTYDLSPSQWVDGTVRVLASLSPTGEHIYIMRSTPRLPFNARTCLADRNLLSRTFTEANDCIATGEIPANDAVFGWLGDAAHRFANVSLVDMSELVCPHAVCSAQRDGLVVFRDSEHLTTQFAESLAGSLASVLQRDGLPRLDVLPAERPLLPSPVSQSIP